MGERGGGGAGGGGGGGGGRGGGEINYQPDAAAETAKLLAGGRNYQLGVETTSWGSKTLRETK